MADERLVVDGVDLTPGAKQDVTPTRRRVLVLSLERLIEVKRGLTRPKDRLMLLQLESLRDELARRS